MTGGFFSGFEAPPKWWYALMAAALAAIAVIYVIGPKGPPTSEVGAAGPATTAEAEPAVVAAFLGDSYTQGVGEGAGYVTPTAEAMGWEAVNLGQASTGYLNPGTIDPANSGPYLDRAPDVVAAAPDIVIVQGSPNDVGVDGDLRAAAAQLFDALKASLPGAQIIVVGPTAPPSLDAAAVGVISQRIEDAAVTAGLPFIDPLDLGWLPPENAALFVADRLHPSAAGYEAYTTGLLAALRQLVPAS